MSALAVKPLDAPVGAEVVDIERAQLLNDDAVGAPTLEALETHGVLVFRGLHIDDETQIAFSGRLGEVVGAGKGREIFRVTLDPVKNPTAQYLKGTFDWHIDGCTDDVPIKATILSAHAVAATGGETEFASSYAAFDTLPEAEQKHLETLRVVHSLEAAQRLVIDNPSEEELAVWRMRPAKTHPLVWRHHDGRKSLVLGATASHIDGMGHAEGRALLRDLLDRATTPDRVYRHEWSVGDLVIWDNRGVLHRAAPYDPTSPRDMHRTTLVGDEPIQ